MNRETQNGLWARIERVRRNLTSDEARLEQILEQSVQAEEKPTPKFKIGDKVKVLRDDYKDEITEIIVVDESDDIAPYKVDLLDDEGGGVWIEEENLEPYTEREPKQTEEEMEEKELNLLTLLKGCEGEKFYSPNYGEIELNEIDGLGSRPLKWQRKENFFHTFSDGRIYSNSEPTIFPSRDLYLKYPLEAAKAWSEWAEERKPKIELQIKLSPYKDGSMLLSESEEINIPINSMDEVDEISDLIHDALTKFHEKNAVK